MKHVKGNSRSFEREISNLGSKDIVIGIMTKNVEDSVSNVIKKIDEGFQKYFPGKRGLIVISDGFSTDKTFENSKKTETETEKIFVEQVGDKGKGNGVKTLFLTAKYLKAKAVAMLDGDLSSIKPEWIKYLIAPILSGKDLVIPFYQRHKYDGRITNQFVYPFIKSFYGADIRQPIGGEYGFSLNLMKTLLAHSKFPGDFGIDVFITTVGICEGFEIVAQELGSKEHSSTIEYAKIDSLDKMFREVITELFVLAYYYDKYRNRGDSFRKIQIYKNGTSGCNSDVKIDPEKLKYVMKTGLRKENEKMREIFSYRIYDSISKQIENERGISNELWAKIISQSLKSSQNGQPIDKVVYSLLPLWHARTKSFVEETIDLTNEQTEKKIEELVDCLSKEFCENY